MPTRSASTSSGRHWAWNSIKSAITTPVENAKTAVSNAIESIKGFFNFSWSLPHLKMPHLSISGGFSISPPSVPHFSISWYKKAMNNGMILDSPTIFGMDGNKLLGAGEAGSETVVGTNSLMSMIQAAVGQAGTIINMTINASEGQDVKELANLVAMRINDMTDRRCSIWACSSASRLRCLESSCHSAAVSRPGRAG